MSTLTSQLAGCKKLIMGDKKVLKVVVFALLTCEEHDGAHHFAVINEGKGVAVSPTAIECLQAQGVDI